VTRERRGNFAWPLGGLPPGGGPDSSRLTRALDPAHLPVLPGPFSSPGNTPRAGPHPETGRLRTRRTVPPWVPLWDGGDVVKFVPRLPDDQQPMAPPPRPPSGSGIRPRARAGSQKPGPRSLTWNHRRRPRPGPAVTVTVRVRPPAAMHGFAFKRGPPGFPGDGQFPTVGGVRTVTHRRRLSQSRRRIRRCFGGEG